MSYRRLAVALVLCAGFAATAGAQYKKDSDIPCEAVESIGTAEMSPDGVITMRLHSLSPNPIAEGELRYAPDDPQYEEIKQHLGGITPGEFKPVKPWC
jgi:hypothetical protein